MEDGTLFLITDDTDIDGDLAEGVEVKVKAVELRGRLIAVEIQAIEIDIGDLDRERYEGIVEDLGDDRFRLEDGTLFLITDDTDIDGELDEGVVVEILARRFANGRIVAIEIEVVEDGDVAYGA